MKNKPLLITLIILLTILAIGLIIGMFYIINGKIRFPQFSSYKVSSNLSIEKTYDLTFEKIRVEAKASEIHVKKTKDTEIKLRIFSDHEKTKVEINNQELFIKLEEKACIGFCFHQTIDKIELYIPEDFEKEINLINEYGNIIIDSFLNADIKIKENCGDVKVAGANRAFIENEYGDIELSKATSASIYQSAGDILVGEVKEITAENEFGDIHITSVFDFLDIKNSCGDIKIDQIDLKRNSTITSSLGNVKIGSTNAIYIDAKTNLGDVKINNNERNADILLKIQNSCGDIKVNN